MVEMFVSSKSIIKVLQSSQRVRNAVFQTSLSAILTRLNASRIFSFVKYRIFDRRARVLLIREREQRFLIVSLFRSRQLIQNLSKPFFFLVKRIKTSSEKKDARANLFDRFVYSYSYVILSSLQNILYSGPNDRIKPFFSVIL